MTCYTPQIIVADVVSISKFEKWVPQIFDRRTCSLKRSESSPCGLLAFSALIMQLLSGSYTAFYILCDVFELLHGDRLAGTPGTRMMEVDATGPPQK